GARVTKTQCGQAEDGRSTMGLAGLPARATTATGYVGARTKCEPGCEVTRGFPSAHVRADLGDDLQNGVTANAVDLGQINTEDLKHTTTKVELRLSAL